MGLVLFLDLFQLFILRSLDKEPSNHTVCVLFRSLSNHNKVLSVKPILANNIVLFIQSIALQISRQAAEIILLLFKPE